jgi:beta-N-acetylhexosaminidase
LSARYALLVLVLAFTASACGPAAPGAGSPAAGTASSRDGGLASTGSVPAAAAQGAGSPAAGTASAGSVVGAGAQNSLVAQQPEATSILVPATPEAVAQAALARMSLEQKVGQVFMLGFVGTELTPENQALIQGLHLGGVTLFGRNIENASQLARLDAALQSVADPVPLFISVDQEGGLVVRVTSGATIFPGNMAVGATGDPQLGRRVAEASATELLAMGVNMDLAPVVDVNTNPLNPVIGTRSFGSNANEVAAFASQSVEGIQSQGVSAVGKHFPGHGDTDVDSHRDLPVVPHPIERLESLEFIPFQAAMRAGVDGIMTAHLYLPSIEPRQDLPATLSKTVLTGLLRERLGYQGLILTDALDMDAIKKARPASEAAVEAFEAGADLLLVSGITDDDQQHLGDGPPALLAAVRAGRISEARLDQSVLRILEAKARRGVLPGAVPAPTNPGAQVLNSPEHRALALEVARKAVTFQRDDGHLLPLSTGTKILVVTPLVPTASDVRDDSLAASLADAIRGMATHATSVEVGRNTSVQSVTEQARQADVVVLATYDLAQQSSQQALAHALAATGKPLVAVGLRGPYDAAAAPEIGTFLTVYGDRPIHVQAAAEALFGKLPT